MLSAMKQAAKGEIVARLDQWGWRLARAAPLDLRGETDDPIAAGYLADGRAFVIDVAMDRCRRGWGAVCFALGQGSLDPIVRTARAHVRDSCTAFEGSPLARYYEHFQPKTAAEVLGLDASDPFNEMSPLAVQMPWSVTVSLETRRAMIRKENRGHGVSLDAEHGWYGFGPVSTQKGCLEMSRLARICGSIRKHGFRRRDNMDGDIRATALIGDKGWVCWIGSGHHRIAALSALGYARVPIRFMSGGFGPLVRRADVDAWPQVRNGLYTRGQALVVFDRILEGRPPDESLPSDWETAIETASAHRRSSLGAE
jgi:hypothetical protein